MSASNVEKQLSFNKLANITCLVLSSILLIAGIISCFVTFFCDLNNLFAGYFLTLVFVACYYFLQDWLQQQVQIDPSIKIRKRMWYFWMYGFMNFVLLIPLIIAIVVNQVSNQSIFNIWIILILLLLAMMIPSLVTIIGWSKRPKAKRI